MTTKRKARQKQRMAERIIRESCGIHVDKLAEFVPRNYKQDFLYQYLGESPMVIAYGSAGSGKSYIGVESALRKLASKQIKKIYITRNPIPTGTSVGLFPGPMEEKMKVWCRPILNHIQKKVGVQTLNNLLDNKRIELVPIEILKGMDFTKSFIILEEAQECTLEQLKMLTTRVGERSTLFINGDIEQTNKQVVDGGFKSIIDAIVKENSYVTEQNELGNELLPWEDLIIPVVEFDDDDCVRSDLCRKMLDIFNTHDI